MIVPKTEENAVLLLAAAYKLGHDSFAVTSTGSGFTASDEIMQEAGFMESPAKSKSPAASAKTTTKPSSKE